MKTRFLISAAVAALVGISSQAGAFETKARHAILSDADTFEYLFVKDANRPVPTASMSKLMTVYLLLDELKKGNISLDTPFSVSENAWRKGGAATGGSTMFLKIGDKVKVEDLLRGIIVQSGNDACIVAAENLAGSEEDFVELMNKRAPELGLKNSHFANSTGLPHPDHKMSMEDLAILAKRIMTDFPEFYHIFSQKEFTYNGIKQWNRNPLLYNMKGADGLKTGHTEEAGFGVVASVKKGKRRLIAVVSGLNSNKERSEEVKNMMEYGFREFDNYKIWVADDVLDEADVWYGKEDKVPLVLEKDLVKTMERAKAGTYKMKIEYDKPVRAPIKKGQKIGEVALEYDGNTTTYPLVAQKDVEETGVVGRFVANVKYLLSGRK